MPLETKPASARVSKTLLAVRTSSDCAFGLKMGANYLQVGNLAIYCLWYQISKPLREFLGNAPLVCAEILYLNDIDILSRHH